MDDNLRITFDTNVEFKCFPGGHVALENFINFDKHILELKYSTNANNINFKKIISLIGSRYTKFSKYAHGNVI